MQPRLTRRRSGWLSPRGVRCEGIFALAILFAGCVGDFGRPRPSIFGDGRAAYMGNEAANALGEPASLFPLTEDEILMRDLAYNLIAPPYDRVVWNGTLSKFFRSGVIPIYGPADVRTGYGLELFGWRYPSATARYARLTDDIRNDIVRIDPFAAAAARVFDLDAKRAKSLAYVSTLAVDEVINAKRRIAENQMIADWVRWCLTERAAGYRFALERLVIAMPSPAAVAAERQLAELERRVGVMFGPVVVPAAVVAK
jgi:hypothetical protein